MDFIQWIVFLAVGGIGGFIGNKLRLPAGTLLGAMVAVGITKYFGIIVVESNSILTFIVQMGLGLMIGVSIASIDREQMKKLSKALIIFTFGVLFMTFVTGYFLSHITNLNIRTLFLSAAPGGLAEMSIIAKSIELNSAIVAILHIIRVFIVLLIFPLIIKYVSRRIENKQNKIALSKTGRGKGLEI